MAATSTGAAEIADEFAYRPAHHCQKDYRRRHCELTVETPLRENCPNGTRKKQERQHRRSSKVGRPLEAVEVSKSHPREAPPMIKPAYDKVPKIGAGTITDAHLRRHVELKSVGLKLTAPICLPKLLA